jgi:hypothetical protein
LLELGGFGGILYVPNIVKRLAFLGPDPLRSVVRRILAQTFCREGMNSDGFSIGDDLVFSVGLLRCFTGLRWITNEIQYLAIFQIAGVDQVGKVELCFFDTREYLLNFISAAIAGYLMPARQL